MQKVDIVKVDARKLSIDLGCIKKIPTGPDPGLIGCKSSGSNVTASLGYGICPRNRASRSRPGPGTGRAGLYPPLRKREVKELYTKPSIL
jgi:hypothetical protein